MKVLRDMDCDDSAFSYPDVLIVGAGLAGLGMGVGLRQAGIDDFVILEKASEVGGTWRSNTYPGCACDVMSMMYSYSFAPHTGWSKLYAEQPEILDYARRVVKDFALEPHLRFDSEVVSYEFDDAVDRWWVRTRGGELYCPRVVVLCHGALHRPNIPEFPGRDRFSGPIVHTAEWDSSIDVTDKRVAVIGTGASAVQLVPAIAGQAAHVEVFQRTPHWVLPKLNRTIGDRERRLLTRVPGLRALYRNIAFWTHEIPVAGFLHPRLLPVLRWAALRTLRKQVPDPALRAKLIPDYTIGCKRILLTSDYYPTLARPDVDLVTAAIAAFESGGVRTADGVLHEADLIVLATGFDTDNRCAREHIVGRDGITIQQAWRDGVQAYLGMSVSGFPNLFLVMGPNSGGGAQSILFVIEAQIRYIVKCLHLLRRGGATRIEVRPEVQRGFNERLHAKLSRSVWNSGGCASWFLDHTGNNRQCWPGTGTSYWWATRTPKARSFRLTRESSLHAVENQRC
ncbi:NAD(P)/FAD-dependent oxidoreductase [Nocardia sp. CDC159]|uniref:NAD(P)/FAD-dependent oxidoreductase n=1 Tax=Nocardia pulmonis TaxID=2951408 RepID=A0A9X2EB56_9NOCA|nr:MULTISPECIES: NAD(P)/FAD-dependent oxidoreductase [Nocardia]MCM6777124.1 NAD(P)/FAD-dependent oxidoreductase [Nocardia pulmonis]MCM6790009.1 NAD(P)/FAD-dependent oxidoreductase [Nocardia sp. CDC159]